MMNQWHRIIMVCALVGGVVGCFGGAQTAENGSKKNGPETLLIPAGTTAPALGLAFDLSYDPATDGIIPGYRIMTVGLTNSSIHVMQMRPVGDEWLIVDRRGKKRKTILSLRRVDPDVWTALPQKLKQLIEYPILVGIGKTEAIDLLVPDHVPLADFRAVIFRSLSLGKTIQIYARETTI